MNTQKEKKIKLLLENWAGEIADILRYEEEGQGIEEDLKDKIQAEIEKVNNKIK